MVRGVCQDDTTKVFTDTITESFPEVTEAEAKPSIPVFLASVGLYVWISGFAAATHSNVYAIGSEINKDDI